MSLIYEAMQKMFKASSGSNYDKHLLDKYGLDDERLKYIIKNLEPIIANDDVLQEKIFIYSFDQKSIDYLHEKHLKVTSYNKCHTKISDTNDFCTSSLHYDGLEELYSRTNNLIQLHPEEFVYSIYTAFQTSHFSNMSTEIKRKLNKELVKCQNK